MSAALESLSDFRGDVIARGTAEYASARNTAFASGSPALLLRPHDTVDVQAAVRFAAFRGVELSVRGGGHSFAGFGTNDAGIVVDLRELADVTIIDPARRLVRVGGGATWGQVGAVLDRQGLAISSGDTKSVGVGGLTLSGGIGWKVRAHGLALDSLVAAQVVTASGDCVRAAADENADLFWAIRGGGGNVGVVTAFDFVAQPATEVHFGKIAFPRSEALRVLIGWTEWLRIAPDALTSVANLSSPTGRADAPVEVYVCFDGDDPAAAARAIDPIRGLGTVIAEDVTLMRHADTLEDGGTLPSGIRVRTRSGFVRRDAEAEVIRTLVEAGVSRPLPSISIRSLGGAVRRVASETTAFAHRDADLMVMTLAAGPDSVVEQLRPVTDRLWSRLDRYVSGAYANFLDSATVRDVAAVYPSGTYRRLATVKRRYDPHNLFVGNHNVPPA